MFAVFAVFVCKCVCVFEHTYIQVIRYLASSLSWSMQVSTVCKKARQKIGVMYSKFYRASTPTLLQLYKACIRPHLEYAAPLWDPHQLGLIKCLENVQKFA